jgi:hypothetical protein
MMMPPCKHVAVFICPNCDSIHIETRNAAGELGCVLIEPDSLNAVIVELMKLRGGTNG